jgi:beta-galactosidase/beta-glucuronidase
MPNPHVIRLRGPWDIQPLARFIAGPDGRMAESAADLPPAGRLTMPADWSALFGRDYCGRARHVRRFNRPTGLTEQSRVWLVLDGAQDHAAVTLNGHRLGSVDGPAENVPFDVTALLLDHNQLVVDVEFASHLPEAPDQCGGLVGEVRLEILAAREPAP